MGFFSQCIIQPYALSQVFFLFLPQVFFFFLPLLPPSTQRSVLCFFPSPFLLSLFPGKKISREGATEGGSAAILAKTGRQRYGVMDGNSALCLSSPHLFFLLYAKQNCHTLLILKTDERVQTAKKSQFHLLCLQSKASNCSLELSVDGTG